MAVQIRKKGLSKWSTTGLDISDSSFAKLHWKEQQYPDSKKKYDLEKMTFVTYADELIEKINRMYARDVFTARDNDNIQCFLPTEYTKLTQANIESARDARWPAQEINFASQEEADRTTDARLKAATVGAYIHSSLSQAAKKQLKGDEQLFKVVDPDGNHFYDGPTYFWKISEIVDPNNDAIIQKPTPVRLTV